MDKRILIVEDDEAINRLIKINLDVAGYQVVCTFDGQQALEALDHHVFDLALLDIMLPEIDGYDLLPHMQEHNVPVIYISAKTDIPSRIYGLRLGAEDYLTKPFDVLELLVRMEKVLARFSQQTSILAFGNITMDEESHRVLQDGQPVSLTPIEYELLRMFLLHPGLVLTREKLLHQVWGDEFLGETRTVDAHVGNLRKKLDLNEQIVTVYKIGYRLEAKA